VCGGLRPLDPQKKCAMVKKTSIHISPVKAGCEQHNRREKELDYVRHDLSHLNETWQEDTIENRMRLIRENYTRSTGQRMQKKATPLREGVAVICENTTMEQLREFARRAEERFGIKTIQIHIHRDEGHGGVKEWKPNLHAHLVFDWTDIHGKSLKLNRQDMAELQTILAESLDMERGKSSEKKHLSALQFKVASEEARVIALKGEISHLKAQKSFFDIIEGLFHLNEKKRLKNEILGLKKENAELAGSIERLNLDNERLSSVITELNSRMAGLADRMERSAREYKVEGERRAVKLINNLLRKKGLPEIDYRAYGDGYENAVYLDDSRNRSKGLSR